MFSFLYSICGLPSRNRILSMSFSACFISSMDCFLFRDASFSYPQFSYISEWTKYWFTAVNSSLKAPFRALITSAFPFMNRLLLEFSVWIDKYAFDRPLIPAGTAVPASRTAHPAFIPLSPAIQNRECGHPSLYLYFTFLQRDVHDESY